MQQSSLDAEAVMIRTLAHRLMTGLAAATATTAPAAILTAPAAIAQSAAPPTVRIGGSSTVFPILQEAIRDYQVDGENRQVRIELRESGTTGGMRQFCRGEIALANASRPISSQELRACAARGVTFIELPIAFDAITVVVHPTNTWARRISTAELSRLWRRSAEGTVTRWKKVNTAWPDRSIKLCGPGKDSGTFDYFNQAINGSPTDSRRDVRTSEDDTVLVDCVARNPEALGYFGFGYYRANNSRLRALPVAGPKGTVTPSVANVQKGRYVPLSRPLFVYVNDRALREQPELRSFVTHTVRRGLVLTEKAGSIPLPADTYRLVESKLYRHVLGTSFGGNLPVGLSIGEALRRSFDEIKRPAYR